MAAEEEGGSSSTSREYPNEQAVASKWSNLRSELNQLFSKITELEMEQSEHALVIQAISPLEPTRKCFRMIGGVLVERTVGEVIPAVQRNKDGLAEVISRLTQALQRKKKELSDFEAEYKIKVRKPDEGPARPEDRREGAAQGVLVGPASS